MARGGSFDEFRYDAERGLLFCRGEPVGLGRRAQKLLAMLLSRRGEIVTKADLIEAAWQGAAVEDSNLSVQMAQLRRLIGAERIRTVERVGYQFIDAPAARPGADRPALAILPFSTDGDCDDVAGQLHEEITMALARFGGLEVLAHRSADSTAGSYLVEGSTRRDGTGVAISVRLIEQERGTYRWAERFRTGLTDPPARLERTAGAVAAAVVAEVERAEMTRLGQGTPDSTDAAALYRRAQRHLRTSSSVGYAAAAHLLERALALDPDNWLYLAGMCEALSHRIGMGWQPLTPNDAEQLYEYARRGLAQGDADADALARFGISLYRTGHLDFGHALTQRAAERNPNSIIALVYAGTSSMHWGDLDEAEGQYRRALGLAPHEPSQSFAFGGLSRISMMRGRFDEALHWAKRAGAANPNYGAAHWTLIAASAQLGLHAEAVRHREGFERIHPGATVATIRSGQSTRAGRMASTLEGLESAGLSAR